MSQQMIEIARPLVVRIENTLLCNHRCPYCYNPDERSPHVDQAQAVANMRRLVEIVATWGVFDVNFTGGEPFTNPATLFAGIEAAVSCGLDFGMNTNTALITRERAARLKGYGIATINASFPSVHPATFDAITGRRGSSDRVRAGFANLAANNIRTSANMVVIDGPNNNLGHVYDTGMFLVREYGIHRFNAAPMSPGHASHAPMMISVDDVMSLMQQLMAVNAETGTEVRLSRSMPICFFEGLDEQFGLHDFFRGCTMGPVNGLTLDLQGNIKVCPVMPFGIANAFTDSFETIMEHLAAYDGRSRTMLERLAPPECATCAVFDVCKGGCKTEALALTGDIRHPSRFMRRAQTDSTILQRIRPNLDLLTGSFRIRDHMLSLIHI